MRLYWDMLDSPAWNCLAASDQRAYIALVRRMKGTNNGDLALTLTQAKHHGIKSQTTLAKSLRALVAVGLLCVTRKGGCTAGGQRQPTLYCITSEPVFEQPKKMVDARRATSDWRQISSIAHGLALIRKAEETAQADADKKKNLVQKLAVTSPKIGLVEPKTSPKNGLWRAAPVQKMDEAKCVESFAERALARFSA